MQNTNPTEKEIFNTVTQKFGRFMTGFTIMTKPHTAYPPTSMSLTDFEFSYTTLLDHTQQTVSDTAEANNTKEIIERVWLSLIAATENSNENRKDEIRGEIVRTGELLGFISPEHRMR